MKHSGLDALARVAQTGTHAQTVATTRVQTVAPTIGDLVAVYRNLHHGKGPVHFWSVRSKRTGLVMSVCAYVDMRGVVFKVGQKARERVLETRRRSVHAVAEGTVVAWDVDLAPRRPASLVECTYNPYRAPYFHLADARHPTQLVPVYHAKRLWFDRDGAWMDAESAREARRGG
jgi:hypothetical protein